MFVNGIEIAEVKQQMFMVSIPDDKSLMVFPLTRCDNGKEIVIYAKDLAEGRVYDFLPVPDEQKLSKKLAV